MYLREKCLGRRLDIKIGSNLKVSNKNTQFSQRKSTYQKYLKYKFL